MTSGKGQINKWDLKLDVRGTAYSEYLSGAAVWALSMPA